MFYTFIAHVAPHRDEAGDNILEPNQHSSNCSGSYVIMITSSGCSMNNTIRHRPTAFDYWFVILVSEENNFPQIMIILFSVSEAIPPDITSAHPHAV